MKIAISTDWHLRGKDLYDCTAQAEAFFEAFASGPAYGIKAHLLLGDLFDSSNICDRYSSTGGVGGLAVRTFNQLGELGVWTYAIRGQHDVSGVGADDALEILRGIPRFEHRSQTGRWGFTGTDEHPHLNLLPLGWDWSGWTVEEALEHAGPPTDSHPSLLMGHLQVKDAIMSGKHTFDGLRSPWMVSKEVLGKFIEAVGIQQAFLGDFHKRQSVYGNKAHYVGAWRQVNHGEAGNLAGFEIWDTETAEVEWVDLDGARRHETIIVSAEDRIDVHSAACGKFKTRVIYQGEPDMADVKRLEELGVQVEQEFVQEERVRRADIPAGILSRPRDLIPLWAQVQEPPIDGERLARALECYDKMQKEG